ncbi:hypothetical protein FO519_002301 [Halicephalobus sp. NKZ332]|nr:hypothetical protein FO519_002301 [Halicephalobus sp. NKZ332]
MAVKIGRCLTLLLTFVLINFILISYAEKLTPAGNGSDVKPAIENNKANQIKITESSSNITVKETKNSEAQKGESPEKTKVQEDKKIKNSETKEDKKVAEEKSTVKSKPVEPSEAGEAVIQKPETKEVPKTQKEKGKPRPVIKKLPDDSMEGEIETYQTKSTSHTFQTLFILFLFIIGCYLCFHNRHKILGMVVEGRSGHRGRRSASGVRYRPLSTDEAAAESGIY